VIYHLSADTLVCGSKNVSVMSLYFSFKVTELMARYSWGGALIGHGCLVYSPISVMVRGIYSLWCLVQVLRYK